MIRSPAVIAVMLIGALVACLIAARAAHQDISIDEAITYRKFVDPASNMHWRADANNHILNSILARVTTGWFGLSEFTLRLPSILAGLAYILFAAVLAELLFGERSSRFCCLAFSCSIRSRWTISWRRAVTASHWRPN